ncbi:MAG: hypothetical protein WAQ05_01370 [Rubrivivax sp.]
MNEFFRTLETQRWDDHRFYHHSRINQSLHFVSAISFLCAYALLFVDPAMAAVVGWCISMTTRQAGHFFFEPRGYDHVNQATDAHKEAIKVGYNIRRKIVLMAIWAGVPALMWWRTPEAGFSALLHDTGLAWLALGVAGLLFRVLQLGFTKNWTEGLAWGFKILTDPFHDIRMYHKAPLALLRGELLDPMLHVQHRK